jgi:hypothetical protein
MRAFPGIVILLAVVFGILVTGQQDPDIELLVAQTNRAKVEAIISERQLYVNKLTYHKDSAVNLCYAVGTYRTGEGYHYTASYVPCTPEVEKKLWMVTEAGHK